MALTGSTIASTYLKLLRINTDTMGADATASYIQDSADTDSVLSISTTRVGIGNAAPASVLHLTGTMQVGVDGTGHDVIFYSGTAGDNFTWDASEECLIITGTDAAQALKVADGDLVVVDKIYLYDNDGGEYISSDGTDLTIASGGALSIAASPLSFSGAATIDTSGNNLLTLQGATAGVRIDDFIGIDTAPSINTPIIAQASVTATSHFNNISSRPTAALTDGATVNSGLYIEPTFTMTNSETAMHSAAGMYIAQPSLTLASGSRTVTNFASLYIANAPSSSGGTITTTNGPYSIFVDAGDCRFDGDIIMADGKGINFAAMTSPADATNMAAETLTDYEEGTWTAAITDGVSTSMAMQNATGVYTKVGNLVTVSGYFNTSSDNGLTNEVLVLTGLPFTIANVTAAHMGGAAGYGAGYDITAGGSVAFYGGPNTTHVNLMVWDVTTGTTNMIASEWDDNGEIIVGFSYRAAE